MTQRQIEVRYASLQGDVREFDEVVARDATVHLEKMSGSSFALIVETRHERACFWIGCQGRRAKVDGGVTSHDQINRRSEAQRRRWNQLTPEQRRRRKR